MSTQVTVFVDARDSVDTNGETGVWVANGPRVGPVTLERVLCDATVAIIALTEDGTPLTVGTSTTAIPPRTRDAIWFRDGGACTADGCHSTYRLQPHHIRARTHKGDQHPDNLTLMCYYHHHIVIHHHGYAIDPTSPPQRRRFFVPRPTKHPPP